jgi:hypothetical protein
MSSNGSYYNTNIAASCEATNDHELVYAALDPAYYDQNIPISVSEEGKYNKNKNNANFLQSHSESIIQLNMSHTMPLR